MTDLAQKSCTARAENQAPYRKEEAKELLKQLKGWTLSGDGKWLSKEFKFQDFKGALQYADSIGEIAEREGHHPELLVSWGRLVVELTTHAIDGLSENDFILAAKIDAL
jgi:4a-hydroxytetrahydrobiopterin dehydratase